MVITKFSLENYFEMGGYIFKNLTFQYLQVKEALQFGNQTKEV